MDKMYRVNVTRVNGTALIYNVQRACVRVYDNNPI